MVGRQGSEVRLIIFLGKEVEVYRGMASNFSKGGGILNGICQVMLAPITSRTLNICDPLCEKQPYSRGE